MTHLDEGLLVSLRDEPCTVPADRVRHLEGCPVCRGALERVRAQAGAVAAGLRALDASAADPEEAREAVRRRLAARRGGGNAPCAPSAGSVTRRWLWAFSRAAGIVLVSAASLWALPGSPVRGWIARLAGSGATAAEGGSAPLPSATEGAVADSAAEEGAAQAGVRLSLAGGALSVVLRAAAPGTTIRVRWVPGDEAALFAPAGSRFTTGEGRLEALLAPGPVRVELPGGKVPFTLEVDGRILLRNTPRGLESGGSALERSEAGITFVVPPR